MLLGQGSDLVILWKSSIPIERAQQILRHLREHQVSRR